MDLAAATAIEPARRRRRRLPIGVTIAAILVFLLAVAALLAPWIAPHDPIAGQVTMRQKPPMFFGGTSEYILGTDSLGRDIFSRIVYGGRISLTLAAISIVVGGIVGTLVGIIAGYYGGTIDAILMRAADIFLSFPAVLLAIVLVSVLGSSYWMVLIIITLLLWPFYARQVRGEVMVLRDTEFVRIARMSGVRDPRIMRRHILPSLMPTLLVLSTLQIGQVILLASTLSFLGVGVPPPTADWGAMIADGQATISYAWWISVVPGVVICLVVLSANVIGDYLRDRLDPRLRGAGK
jgi:peptide/nickel transport system permease protein